MRLLLLLIFLTAFLVHPLDAFAQLPPSNNSSDQDFQSLETKAEQGDAQAQYALAMLYHKGIGVEQDDSVMVMWLNKAATQESPIAEFALGESYQKGIGQPVDMEQAEFWIRKAAEHGNAKAEMALAGMYLTGTGVEKDMDEYAKWHDMALQQNAQAQNNKAAAGEKLLQAAFHLKGRDGMQDLFNFRCEATDEKGHIATFLIDVDRPARKVTERRIDRHGKDDINGVTFIDHRLEPGSRIQRVKFNATSANAYRIDYGYYPIGAASASESTILVKQNVITYTRSTGYAETQENDHCTAISAARVKRFLENEAALEKDGKSKENSEGDRDTDDDNASDEPTTQDKITYAQ